MNEPDNDKPEELKPQEAGELRLLYQVGIGDIAFLKRQQLALTNYGVLLYIALVTVSTSLKKSPLVIETELLIAQLIVTSVVFLVMVFGIKLLYSFQKSIGQARGRVRRSREQFSQRFWDVFQTRRGEEYESFFFSADLVLLEMGVFIIGAFVAFTMVWLV